MANLAELVVQGIVTASGGGAVVATLNAYFSRRTTQARQQDHSRDRAHPRRDHQCRRGHR
jgi:hypothetical protein